MKKKYIAMGREFGSGGRTIGKAVAQRLGLKYYDEELLHKIADYASYEVEFVRQMDDTYSPGRNRLSYYLAGRDSRGQSVNDYLFQAECKAIREIASGQPSLIVGRCSDYLLGDREDVLTVFIHADKDWRAARILEQYGETRTPIMKRIQEKDTRRRANYNYHTGREWGNVSNYDLCLNSSRLGIETCVDVICRVFQETEEQ
ncbi:cytidylate kinase 2 [Clostridium sp. SY8519]|uniref:cytidylate kinase-like family protein n=1 Tax=Clostridium sp. (strain SY8519) TaxID=1042156 RepID=UPI0002171A54|nr:cytidylate kinase family protein [Clostridium sp. SY8519]BAK47493.1 cytidylate kinase 2 [Clostridium sp. SY8519]